MRNYLIYPTKKMYITQRYDDTFSHVDNFKGNPCDYPIDESCGDSKRDYFYCPCDEMVIRRIYGVGEKGTNTAWMESTSKVVLANNNESFVTIMVVHPNDDTLKDLYVGKTFKRGEAMFMEGMDGYATGNHFHISVSASKYIPNGSIENDRGMYVIKGSAIKPENAFFVDESFTKIINSNGLKFKSVPKHLGISIKRDTAVNQIEVIIPNLRARKSPNGQILGYINLGVYNVLESVLNGEYIWYRIDNDLWIASKDNEWTKYYPKEEIKEERINILRKILRYIISLFTK